VRRDSRAIVDSFCEECDGGASAVVHEKDSRRTALAKSVGVRIAAFLVIRRANATASRDLMVLISCYRRRHLSHNASGNHREDLFATPEDSFKLDKIVALDQRFTSLHQVAELLKPHIDGANA